MNKSIIFGVCGFIAGVATGFVVARKFIKNTVVEKYILDKSDEEAPQRPESSEADESNANEECSDEPVNRDPRSDPSVLYTNISPSREYDPNKVDHFISDPIYTIKPEVFGEYDDYKTEFLVMYADRVVADQNMDILPHTLYPYTIGDNFAEDIGVFEQNVVHIRNEIFKVDFEIVYDISNFHDMILEDDVGIIDRYSRLKPENRAAWDEWDALTAEITYKPGDDNE